MNREVRTGLYVGVATALAWHAYNMYDSLDKEQTPIIIEPRQLTVEDLPISIDLNAAEHELVVEQTFEDVKAYWIKQGVDISDTKVDFLTNDETAVCSPGFPKEQASDMDVAEYCPNTNQVLISGAFVVRLLNNESGTAGINDELKIVVSHEVGHAVQYETGEVDFGSGRPYEEAIKAELQADCYAGVAMQAIDPSVADNGEVLYGNFPLVDPTHGSRVDRLAHFNKGATKGNCAE